MCDKKVKRNINIFRFYRGKVDNSDRWIVMTPHVSQKLQVQLNLFIYESCGYSQALLT